MDTEGKSRDKRPDCRIGGLALYGREVIVSMNGKSGEGVVSGFVFAQRVLTRASIRKKVEPQGPTTCRRPCGASRRSPLGERFAFGSHGVAGRPRPTAEFAVIVLSDMTANEAASPRVG